MRGSFALVCILFVAAPCGGRKAVTDDNSLVEYAKALDVARLDKALPSQRLDVWLSRGPAHLDEVRWRMSDCDLKAVDREPPEGYPMCVAFTFRRDTLSGKAMIRVGTTQKGIDGEPRFESVWVTSGAPGRIGRFRSTRILSEFPTILREIANEDRQENGKQGH